MSDGLHIGIIMDGNRRFAKRLMKEPWKGHEYGVKKFEEILDWCEEVGVGEVTIYTLSVQNLNRPKHELDYLMNLFRKEISGWTDNESKVMSKSLRVRYFGRKDLLPNDIQEGLDAIEEATKDNTSFKLNFCVAYGGREEIVDAIHKIAVDVKEGRLSPMEIDDDLIDDYVYMPDKPDFIIRTGGDVRTSNFLVWQSVYSEWFFVDKLWPELDKETFLGCVDDFNNRDRRFGR